MKEPFKKNEKSIVFNIYLLCLVWKIKYNGMFIIMNIKSFKLINIFTFKDSLPLKFSKPNIVLSKENILIIHVHLI